MPAITFAFPNRESPTNTAVALAQLAATYLSVGRSFAPNLSGLPGAPAWTPKPCTILTNRDSFVIPYTDPQADHGNIQRRKWVTVDRTGAMPLVGDGGGVLRTLKLRGILGDTRRDSTWIEGQMRNLSYMLSVPEPLTIAYGRFEAEGIQWRCTNADISTVLRTPGDNMSYWVKLDLAFIEASDAPFPQPAPAVPVEVAPPPPPPPEPAKTTYTVKKGDTLWGTAVKYYHDGTKWPKIADANGIRDPKRLQIGTVLTIP